MSRNVKGLAGIYETAKDNTRILDYYNENNNSASRKKKYNGSRYYWWLRSAYSHDSNFFFNVTSSGNYNYNSASGIIGAAAAFRIG